MILRWDHPDLEWVLISISITIRDWEEKKEDTEGRDVIWGRDWNYEVKPMAEECQELSAGTRI